MYRPVLAPLDGVRIRYAVEFRISVTPFGEKENWIVCGFRFIAATVQPRFTLAECQMNGRCERAPRRPRIP
jgi:hypothetical protein